MNVLYGSQASHIHNIKITKIGPYEQQLPIGAIQTMMFTDTDTGPFWLDDSSRVAENKIRVLIEGVQGIIPRLK